MLDDTSIDHACAGDARQPAPNWRDTLVPGAIVACRYPIDAGDVGVDPRPCLVLEIETIGHARYALIAPGLPLRHCPSRGYDVRISRRGELAASGLDAPMCFAAAMRVLVPLGSGALIAHHGTPVIGRLQGASLDRMHAVRARIHAMRDIAADRRAQRRRERRAGVVA